MIALLEGRVVHRENSRAIVSVHGVGYEVFAPNRTIEAWVNAPDPITAHVSTQVREDAITLFGFATALERQAFGVLLGVSGIGPKLALACLDAVPLDSLVRAVEGDDHALLSRIPGVGKKTAQRLALELKGKLPMPLDLKGSAAAAAPVAAPATDDTFALALQRLGYNRPEIERARQGLVKEGIADDAPVAERLRVALRVLYGGDR